MLFPNTQVVVKKQDAKLLFLHGLFSNGEHSYKCSAMRFAGFDVDAPQLNNWLFWWAVRSVNLSKIKPDIIVGSSRGGAVALNLETDLPMVLLAPAWKHYGKKPQFKNLCYVIHGEHDDLIPYQDSIELVADNPNARLLLVNDDHQLNSFDTHRLMVRAVERLADLTKK